MAHQEVQTDSLISGLCRVTALALLRHLTNLRIMGNAVQSRSEAWQAYENWRSLREIALLAEPEALDKHLKDLSHSLELSPTLWTDAYLAAFALAGGFRLVAFDSDFHRFPGLNLFYLTP